MGAVAMETDAKAKLARSLEKHLQSPEYIKGWEVDKRRCVGAKRQSLRKAARDAKRELRGEGKNWLKAILNLQMELAAAGEADFDGLLSEALAACDAATPSGGEEIGACALKLAQEHLKRPPKVNGARDYEQATKLADSVRSASAAWVESQAAMKKARAAYASAVIQLQEELVRIGEGDFDGLLRQAVKGLRDEVMLPASVQPLREEMQQEETPDTVDAPPITVPSPDMEPPPITVPSPDMDSTPPPITVPSPDMDANSALPYGEPPDGEVMVLASPRPVPASLAPVLPLRMEVSEIDEGCVRLGTLPAQLQARIEEKNRGTGTRTDGRSGDLRSFQASPFRRARRACAVGSAKASGFVGRMAFRFSRQV